MLKHQRVVKVVYLSGITSPFWIEFFSDLSVGRNIIPVILETELGLTGRQEHWRKFNVSPLVKRHTRMNGENLMGWVSNHCLCEGPDVIVVNGFSLRYLITVWFVMRKLKTNPLLLMFVEQPNRSTFLKSWIKKQFYRAKLAIFSPSAILAIGDRARDYYSSIVLKNTEVYLLPYSQNNKKFIPNPFLELKKSDVIKLVFCGQFIERNNPLVLLESFIKISMLMPGRFSFSISGGGPLLAKFKKGLDSYPLTAESVSFFNEFDTWDERMSVYQGGHILLLPASHSGWGLIVPEALACGLVVISTTTVESARYLIKDFYNGFLIKPDVEHILRLLIFLSSNVSILNQMRVNAIESSYYGESSTVAESFAKLLSYFKKNMAE